MEKKESYTPAEAKRVYDRLDKLIAEKALTDRQVGAHRRHIASRARVAPKEGEQAARRARSEIVKLMDAGTITPYAARAYRAHVTKRTRAI
jgi:hypothetical protein